MAKLEDDLRRNLKELTVLEQEINEYWRPWVEQSKPPVPERLKNELFGLYRKLRHRDKYTLEEITRFAAEVGRYWNEDAYGESGAQHGPSDMDPSDLHDFNRLNEIIKEIETGYLTESDVKGLDSWFQGRRSAGRRKRQPDSNLQALVDNVAESLHSMGKSVTAGTVWIGIQEHFKNRTPEERGLESYFYTVNFESEDSPTQMDWEDKNGNSHSISRSSLTHYIKRAKQQLGI